MNHRTKRFYLFSFILILASHFGVKAQQSLIYLDADAAYKSGLELYDNERYGAAQEQFSKIINSANGSNEIRTNSEYYYAMCSANQLNKDADYLLTTFIENHPESNKEKNAIFQLGKMYYKQKNYKKAIEWLAKTDVSYLSSDEEPEYYFKLGYSEFRLNKYDSAAKAFYNIIEVDTKYTPQANYYYAHIAYVNRKYETALKCFLRIKDDLMYKNIVPSYIAQIYFMQGNYDALIAYAVPLLPGFTSQNVYEIKRMLGEAYYQRKDYKKAYPYLEDYYNRGAKDFPFEIYQLAYASYKSEEYDKARKYFEEVADSKDSLGQNAMYHLGDIFIRLNKKQNALNAFRYAAQQDFDKNIKEDAMFNYAKLSFEISYQPLAIEAFQNYISSYPNSARTDEANEYLLGIYLTTNDYKAAIAAIEKIKNKSTKVKTAYQKCAFNLGVVSFNDGKLDEASKYFDLSVTNAADAKLEALAIYWRSEIFYKKALYNDAIKGYEDFIFMPNAVSLPEYNLANYNVGYCYYNKKDYPNSQKWFRKYVNDKSDTDSSRFNDACLRIADCYFISKEYPSAIQFYDKGINNHSKATDYALFQKGMIFGIQGKLKDKTEVLQSILDNYKKSPYYDDAMYQIANAHLVAGENVDAIKMYKTIVSDYPNSNYLKQSLLAIALIYYNDKDNEKALMTYKEVIAEYPSTAEAKDALAGIKSIYMDESNIKEYLNYAGKLPFANISKASQDSLLYQSAELRYMKGDCDGASDDFINYLQSFPEGYFVLNANFYKSECDFKAKKYNEALTGYNFVSNKSKNNFSETALSKASWIYFSQQKCDSALLKYTKLEEYADTKQSIAEAQIGEMRCYFNLGNPQKAIENAQKVITNEKSSNELLSEAHLVSGKAAINLDSLDAAEKELKAVIKITESEMSAEARYNLALIQFKKKEYKKSQDILFELIKMVPSYDYWIAKGFILLGDDYLLLDDSFQAKHTWQSIIDNYEGADLKAIAQQKLDDLKKKEDDQKPKDNQDKKKDDDEK
jgi:TolA-binding protein